MPRPVILDGPMGTELARRGVDLSGPAWSARALEQAPDVVGAIHADYAAAGATVHTAATFRTQPRALPEKWRELASRAVEIARRSVPRTHRIAGSIAPLADCYRPDLSPARDDPSRTRAEHFALATALIDAGCEILLCETFTHAGEALLATEAALEAAEGTDTDVWLALSPGYRDDLLSRTAIAEAATRAASLGAAAVLVNCAPMEATLAHLRAIGTAVWGRGVAVGAYANAGTRNGRWREGPEAAATYAAAAEGWVRAGAGIVGSCCGTTPEVTKALAALQPEKNP